MATRQPKLEKILSWLPRLVAPSIIVLLAFAVPALAADGDGDDCLPTPEVCDGVDNDCDGTVDEDPDPVGGGSNDGDAQIDEGFGFCLFAQTGPLNVCKTPGRFVCANATLSCGSLGIPVVEWANENDAAGNCGDGVDNDCDGFVDVADPACPKPPEICDGIDNDFDTFVDEGFDVGVLCSVGVGACSSSGLNVCSPGGASSVCSAVPGTPGNEGTLFENSCDDLEDNDCDGFTNLADDGCFGFGQAELCGNLTDDDGDGLVDEGFPTLGLPCTSGTGICATPGTIVCSGDLESTVCSSAPGGDAGFEGDDLTCTDFLDNDCDGVADAADSECAPAFADAGVTCSLPYDRGKPGADCTGWHIIQFDGGSATEVQADLLALDTDGSLLGIIENVQLGQEAHLASRLGPGNFKVDSKTNKQGTRHTMFAPMPILRVTGTKNGVEDVAYCSIMPYLEVSQPNGVTVSVNDASDLDVEAFLPLVNVDKLGIKLNGLDLLAAIQIVPSLAFPTGGGALCSNDGDCVFQMEAGCGDGSLVDVEISNLRVEGLDTSLVPTAKDGSEAPDQVNTVTFTVKGLPAGGHIFYFTGSPLPLNKRLSAQCFVDDLADTGKASAFGIAVNSPTYGEVVASAPVTVEGKVCGGNEIASFQINAAPVDVSSQTCTTVDPNSTTDTPECFLDFTVPIYEKSIAMAVEGEDSAGKFKRGSNRVIADASDVLANRTFNTGVIFGLGNVSSPAGTTAMALELGANRALADALADIQMAMTTQIDPAFIVGLKEQAVQEFFNAKCTGAIADFTARATASLENTNFGDFTIEPDCSCNITTPIVLEDLTFTDTTFNPACKVDFRSGEIGVVVNLPSVRIQAGAHDSCEDEGLFGECIARTVIDVTAVTHIRNVRFEFDITESQIETKTPPDPSAFTYAWTVQDNGGDPLFTAAGTCDGGPRDGKECYFDGMCEGSACEGEAKNATGGDPGEFTPITSNNSGLECWGADVCSAFQVLGAVLIEVFTFGLADGFAIVGFLDFDFDFNQDFLDELKAAEPDAMELDEAEVDEGTVADAGHASFTPGDINVTIDPGVSDGQGGLTVDFGAEFSVQNVDSTIPETPGAPLTPAGVPTVAKIIGVGDDVTMLVADDVFGQIFAAMKASGALQATCTAIDDLTVEDLLPADVVSVLGCETIGPDNVVGATLRGMCHAIRGANCSTLPDEGGGLLNNTKVGVCVGFQGGDCTTLPFGPKQVCNLTPYRDIQSTDGILACARQDTEPELLFSDESTLDSTADVHLLLEDLNVVFALDRNNDQAYDGTLEALPNCFTGAANGAGDCKVIASCLDLSIDAKMGIDSSECTTEQAGFVFSDLMIVEPASDIIFGAMCGAAPPNDDAQALLQSFESKVIDSINQAAENFTPPICIEGLDLGGVLDFNSPDAKLFGLTTGLVGVTPGFSDYLGITVGLKVPPP